MRLTALGLVLTLGFAVSAEEKCGKCPVSNQPAKASASVDVKGKKLYFCCDGCPAAYEKNPEKFAAKANLQFATTGQIVQVACPFSGKPCKEGTEVDVEGVSVSFCCNGCQAKTEKAKDKLALIFAKVEKGFTSQTKCPVSNKPINASASIDHKGKKVYFCCPGCPDAFKADPAKYEAKLPKS